MILDDYFIRIFKEGIDYLDSDNKSEEFTSKISSEIRGEIPYDVVFNTTKKQFIDSIRLPHRAIKTTPSYIYDRLDKIHIDIVPTKSILGVLCMLTFQFHIYYQRTHERCLEDGTTEISPRIVIKLETKINELNHCENGVFHSVSSVDDVLSFFDDSKDLDSTLFGDSSFIDLETNIKIDNLKANLKYCLSELVNSDKFKEFSKTLIFLADSDI